MRKMEDSLKKLRRKRRMSSGIKWRGTSSSMESNVYTRPWQYTK